MPIKRGNTDRAFSSYIDSRVREIKTKAVKMLCKVGEIGHKLAVEHGSYQDQTGNLRSSIGWGVVQDGQLVRQGGFTRFLQGSEGAQRGRDRLRELASQQGRGIALIIVAGESYAIYVEAMGFDVITFSELKCYALAKQLINKILK